MESSGTSQATTNNINPSAAPVSPFAPTEPVTQAANPVVATDATNNITMANIPEPSLQAEQSAVASPATNTASTTVPATATPVASTVAESKPIIPDADEREANDTPLSTDVTIEALLEECINHNASDLHIQVGLPPVLRIDGTLRPITTYPVLDNKIVQELIFATLDEDQQKILLKDKEFDYSFAFGDLGRFRVNAFHERGNMAAAFR